MIEVDKLKSKVEALKMKYSSHWVTHPQGDTFCGCHDFMDMMLSEAIKYGFEQGESFGKCAVCADEAENERTLKIEIEKLRKELESETRSHTYWREEYYKLLDKRGVE